MTKNYYNIYIAAVLSFVICMPPRFAYAIIGILLLNLLIYSGLGLKFLMDFLKIEQFVSLILLFCATVFTILYKMLLNALCPVIALNCGFSIYLITFSSYLIGNLLDTLGNEKFLHLKRTAVRVSVFSLCVLFFFLLRDIIAYGTITLPAKYGLKVLQLFSPSEKYFGYFLATIPGSLIVFGLVFCLFAHINHKYTILKRAE